MSMKRNKIVEILVIISFVPLHVWCIGMLILYFSSAYYCSLGIRYTEKAKYFCEGILFVYYGVLVFYWGVFCNGIKSRIWKWLIPFIGFSFNEGLRWICVFLFTIWGLGAVLRILWWLVTNIGRLGG